MAGPHQPYGCPTRPALTKSYVCMHVCMYTAVLFCFAFQVKEYDSISRLDQWLTTILLRIKKGMNEEPDLT